MYVKTKNIALPNLLSLFGLFNFQLFNFFLMITSFLLRFFLWLLSTLNLLPLLSARLLAFGNRSSSQWSPLLCYILPGTTLFTTIYNLKGVWQHFKWRNNNETWSYYNNKPSTIKNLSLFANPNIMF